MLTSENIDQTAAPQVDAELKKRIANQNGPRRRPGLGIRGVAAGGRIRSRGFNVTGIDVQKSKVDQFNAGHSYIKDVKDSVFEPLVKSGKLRRRPIFR